MYEVLMILTALVQERGWKHIVGFALFVVLPMLIAATSIGNQLILY